MHSRFPELVLRIPDNPTQDQIDAGLWCPPGFEPDESRMTLLDRGMPMSKQFASMEPECIWLEGKGQTIVSISSAHSADPGDHYYSDLSKIVGLFARVTRGQERVGLREGRLWEPEALKGDDATIIKNSRDMPFFQVLMQREGIECRSAEPIADKEILAVIQERPDLRLAVSIYKDMRMLAQLWAKQSQYQGSDRLPIVPDLRLYVAGKRRAHFLRNDPRGARRLYPMMYDDPVRLKAMAAHLCSEHGFSIRYDQLNEGPSDEVKEQVFRCTTPLFRPAGNDTLCRMEQVAVLVNRLRDRRRAFNHADLGRAGISFIDLTGWPHLMATLPALKTLAAERSLTIRQELSQELGLVAIRAVTSLAI